MTRWADVGLPAEIDGAAPHLGRLGHALQWLAAAQGNWPPRTPRPLTVVVHAPAPDTSLESGAARADAAADSGTDLLVVGSAGDQGAGLVLAAALLGLEPVRAVGTGASVDWTRLTVTVRDGLRLAKTHLGDPPALLEAAGGGAVAELTGLLAQAAVRRTPVVLDGSPLVIGAALVAERLAPGARRWWLAGQAPPSPGAAAALVDLRLTPLLDLGLAGPDGADLAALLLTRGAELVQADAGA